MSYTQELKQRACEIDPQCWVSYSGKPKDFKRYMEHRRKESIRAACDEFFEKGIPVTEEQQ